MCQFMWPVFSKVFLELLKERVDPENGLLPDQKEIQVGYSLAAVDHGHVDSDQWGLISGGYLAG